MGVLHDPLSAGPLLNDGDHGVVLEPHRGVDPEESSRGVGGPDARRFRLTDRTDPPRAIPRSPPSVRGETDLSVTDFEGAVPGSDLGEAGGVEDDPVELPIEMAGLEVGLGESLVHGVEFDTPLVGLDDHSHLFEPFDHLDPDRSHRGIHPIGAEGLGGADHPVVLTPQDGNERVRHAQVGVLADSDDCEELVRSPVYVASAMDVEVVAIVEVAIRGPHVAHGLGDLMDRVVVKGGQHGDSSVCSNRQGSRRRAVGGA